MASPISLTTSTDYLRVQPGQARLHVVFELEARGSAADARPRLQMIFAVDVSGSMMGRPLEQVVRSVERLLDLLAAEDELGVVAFSDGATEVTPLAALSSDTKRAVRRRMARLQSSGNTNIEGALRLAHSLFGPPQGARQAILLLSDGQPNVGLSSAPELRDLARSFRPDRAVSVLGYGAGHDEKVLAAISEGGGGIYRFVSDPATCQPELAQAIGSQADVVAESVELVLTPDPEVEIARIVGSPSTRVSAEGMVVPLPDMVDGARQILAVEVRARLDPQRLTGGLLNARVRCRTAGSREQQVSEDRVTVDISAGEPARDLVACGKVLLARADETRAEARALADRGGFDGAARVLRGLIAEIEALPGFVAMDGSALSEARELLLDEAMAMERRPSAEAYNIFKKASLASRLASDGAAASSRPRSARSLALYEASAGPLPKAVLIVLQGPDPGQRFRLGPSNTIGRTPTAEICIGEDSISRRHADIFALMGDFWITDLGSTNTTCVNGQELSQPHKLASGDLITMGQLVLRFELEPSPEP